MSLIVIDDHNLDHMNICECEDDTRYKVKAKNHALQKITQGMK